MMTLTIVTMTMITLLMVTMMLTTMTIILIVMIIDIDKVVHLVRDPRAIINSVSKRSVNFVVFCRTKFI